MQVQDRELKLMSGGTALFAMLIAVIAAVWVIFDLAQSEHSGTGTFARVLTLIVFGFGAFISLFGFKVNGPNQARVVQLFGAYVGTIKEVGFFWGNPFYSTNNVSMRVRTFETDVEKTEEIKDATGKVTTPATCTTRPFKVNDKDGTPIEIAALVVWRVVNPTQAVFEVDRYEEFVKVQSDAALRSLACRYSYDSPEADVHSLRGHIDEVAAQLKQELQPRMHQAGVEIQEARITKLAYATEIASAMLQRQQAGAVIAARAKIVEGAVGMVEHALEMLSEKNIVELDTERKAAMVCNLLVVLCGHATPQPVLNTGTLHN